MLRKTLQVLIGAGQRMYCSICNKNVSVGHKHVPCDLCGGTGKLNY